MNWNEYQNFYKGKYGSAAKTDVTAAYYKQKGLNKILKSVPKTRKAEIKRLKTEMKNIKTSPTRGFRAASPQRGKERTELLNKCGNDAFLIPKEKKFPVMTALRVNNNCEYSCEGLNAAKNRACQYDYIKEANKAQKLGEQYCNWSPKKRACNK